MFTCSQQGNPCGFRIGDKGVNVSESENIGRRLKQIREKNGLTLEKLGEIFILSKGSISRYENGERMPDLEFVEAFSKHFNVNLAWLVNNESPIFKGEEGKGRNSKDLFLELSAVIDNDNDPESANLSDSLSLSLDKLGDDTPSNYVTLLSFMRKNPELRKTIFQIFYLLKNKF